MSKELRIPHKQIANNKTITPEMERIFKESNLDLHVNEVEELEDDFDKGERVLKVKTTKYFVR
jgi:hypothetical protein